MPEWLEIGFIMAAEITFLYSKDECSNEFFEAFDIFCSKPVRLNKTFNRINSYALILASKKTV